jgi:hypothetical protein
MCHYLNATEQTQNSNSGKNDTYANSLESPITSVSPTSFRMHGSAIVAERQLVVMMIGVKSR